MNEVKKFFKSFFFAGRGILATIASERNMRVHLTFLIYMFSILLLTDWFIITKLEWVALIFASLIVISGELVNTAIEKVVDLASKGTINEYAKKAKDAASGAVLISAIGSVIIGIIILYQKSAFIKMFDYFSNNIQMLIVFIISIVIAVLLIFTFPFIFNKIFDNK